MDLEQGHDSNDLQESHEIAMGIVLGSSSSQTYDLSNSRSKRKLVPQACIFHNKNNSHSGISNSQPSVKPLAPDLLSLDNSSNSLPERHIDANNNNSCNSYSSFFYGGARAKGSSHSTGWGCAGGRRCHLHHRNTSNRANQCLTTKSPGLCGREEAEVHQDEREPSFKLNPSSRSQKNASTITQSGQEATEAGSNQENPSGSQGFPSSRKDGCAINDPMRGMATPEAIFADGAGTPHTMNHSSPGAASYQPGIKKIPSPARGLRHVNSTLSNCCHSTHSRSNSFYHTLYSPEYFGPSTHTSQCTPKEIFGLLHPCYSGARRQSQALSTTAADEHSRRNIERHMSCSTLSVQHDGSQASSASCLSPPTNSLRDPATASLCARSPGSQGKSQVRASLLQQPYEYVITGTCCVSFDQSGSPAPDIIKSGFPRDNLHLADDCGNQRHGLGQGLPPFESMDTNAAAAHNNSGAENDSVINNIDTDDNDDNSNTQLQNSNYDDKAARHARQNSTSTINQRTSSHKKGNHMDNRNNSPTSNDNATRYTHNPYSLGEAFLRRVRNSSTSPKPQHAASDAYGADTNTASPDFTLMTPPRTRPREPEEDHGRLEQQMADSSSAMPSSASASLLQGVPFLRSTSPTGSSVTDQNKARASSEHSDSPSPAPAQGLAEPESIPGAVASVLPCVSSEPSEPSFLTHPPRPLIPAAYSDGHYRIVDNAANELVVHVGMVLLGWLEVLELLGSGTFGAVYLCRDLRTPDNVTELYERQGAHHSRRNNYLDEHYEGSVTPPSYDGEALLRGSTTVTDFSYYYTHESFLEVDYMAGRLVAVKVIHNTPIAEMKSYEEAEMLQMLNNNDEGDAEDTARNNKNFHLCRILASGGSHGHHCLVLPRYYCNLYELLAQNHLVGLDINIVRRILKQLLLALHRLHERHGYIHCDIKPENIMVDQPIEFTRHRNKRRKALPNGRATAWAGNHHNDCSEREHGNADGSDTTETRSSCYTTTSEDATGPAEELGGPGGSAGDSLLCEAAAASTVPPYNSIGAFRELGSQNYSFNNHSDDQCNEDMADSYTDNGPSSCRTNSLQLKDGGESVSSRTIPKKGTSTTAELSDYGFSMSFYNASQSNATACLINNSIFDNLRRFNISLIDFGCSTRRLDWFWRHERRGLPSEADSAHDAADPPPRFPYIQSRYYRPPEVLLATPYGTGVDVWSAAVTALEMMLGRPVMVGVDNYMVLRRIILTLGEANARGGRDEALDGAASRDSTSNPPVYPPADTGFSSCTYFDEVIACGRWSSRYYKRRKGSAEVRGNRSRSTENFPSDSRVPWGERTRTLTVRILSNDRALLLSDSERPCIKNNNPGQGSTHDGTSPCAVFDEGAVSPRIYIDIAADYDQMSADEVFFYSDPYSPYCRLYHPRDGPTGPNSEGEQKGTFEDNGPPDETTVEYVMLTEEEYYTREAIRAKLKSLAGDGGAVGLEQLHNSELSVTIPPWVDYFYYRTLQQLLQHTSLSPQEQAIAAANPRGSAIITNRRLLFLDLISKMLRPNPRERISVRDALRHPFIRDHK